MLRSKFSLNFLTLLKTTKYFYIWLVLIITQVSYSLHRENVFSIEIGQRKPETGKMKVREFFYFSKLKGHETSGEILGTFSVECS